MSFLFALAIAAFNFLLLFWLRGIYDFIRGNYSSLPLWIIFWFLQTSTFLVLFYLGLYIFN